MSGRSIALYYWLTPVFWLVDWSLGASLRAAGLEGHPVWQALYYLFCGGCGVAIWKRPGWTAVIGLAESSVNILTLVLGIFVPYLHVIDRLAAGDAVVDASPFALDRIAGLLLAGSVWAGSFHLESARMRRRAR